MDINFKEITEYIRKASILDAIINYAKASDYLASKDILNIAGVGAAAQDELQEEEAE